MSAGLRRVARLLVPRRIRPWAYTTYMRVRHRGDPLAMKHAQELSFWMSQRDQEGGRLHSGHIHRTFVEAFKVPEEQCRGARMLDIGCGPLGSLEWATMAKARVGLDPLADSYRSLGVAQQQMTYVGSQAERMPFPESSFDIVSSFNSLDHVDDLDQTIAEVKRVLVPGGVFLLLVEVNHAPTLAEPIAFSWDVTTRFAPQLEVVFEQHLDTSDQVLYDAALAGAVLDDPNESGEAGLLVKFRKKG